MHAAAILQALAAITCTVLQAGTARGLATNPNAIEKNDVESLQLFRRLQDGQTCDTNDWEGNKIIARNGKPYKIGASSMRAVSLDLKVTSTAQAFEFWCTGSKQKLGHVFMGLYKDKGGEPGDKVVSVESKSSECSDGWNTVDLPGDGKSLQKGKYWIVIMHKHPWITAYSTGVHLWAGAKDLVKLKDNLEDTFVVYQDQPNTGIPLAVKLCARGESRKCVEGCFSNKKEPVWKDAHQKCRWLVKVVPGPDKCIKGCSNDMMANLKKQLQRCQEGYHGFSADVNKLSSSLKVENKAKKWISVVDYESQGVLGRGGLFNFGHGFDGTSGRYTANKPGIYLTSANLRLDQAKGKALSAIALSDKAFDGIVTASSGIDGGEYGINNFMMTGLMNLKVGDSMRLEVKMEADSSYYIVHETGFSAVEVTASHSVGAQLAEGMTVDKPNGTQWYELKAKWTTSGGALFSKGSGFDSNSGKFTAPEDGIYYLATNVMITGIKSCSYVRTTIAVNGKPDSTEGTGLHSRGVEDAKASALSTRTDVVSGIVQLKKGETVSVFVLLDTTVKFTIDKFTYFYATKMNSREGFLSQLRSPLSMKNQKDHWLELRDYRIKGFDSTNSSDGLFATSISSIGLPTGLNLIKGRYTAGIPGVYWATANVRTENLDQGSFVRVAVALNGVVNDAQDAGLAAISGQIDKRVKDISVAGLIQLDNNDYISVWLKAEKDDDFVILKSSSFSAAFVTSPPRKYVQCIEKKNEAQDNDVCSNCIATGASCSRCANIFGFDCGCACKADHCMEKPNPKYGGDTCSDCLHSGASCMQCNSTFGFDCSCACDKNNNWAQWRPNRCFNKNCGENGFCHEGNCQCKDGYSGSKCVVPPGQGFLCGADRNGDALQVTTGKCDSEGSGKRVILGESDSHEQCRQLCRTHAENADSLEGGCCERASKNGTAVCYYYPGTKQLKDAGKSGLSTVASICSIADIKRSLDKYSLRERDCRDIQPVTEHLVEAVIKLHSQLHNRACVPGYYENEFGICMREVPLPIPIATFGPRKCAGFNPNRRGLSLDCVYERGDDNQIKVVDGPDEATSGIKGGIKEAMVFEEVSC